MLELVDAISDLLKRIDEGRKTVRETQSVSDDFDATCATRNKALDLSQELLSKMIPPRKEEPADSQTRADYERQKAEYEAQRAVYAKLNEQSSVLFLQFQETIAFIDPFRKDLSLLLERLPLKPEWDVYRQAIGSLEVGHRSAWADRPATSALATLEMRLREMLDLAIQSQPRRLRRFDPFPTPDGAGWNDVSITFIAEHRVDITTLSVTQTRNYAEMGFEDGRGGGGKPNSAWTLLTVLAGSAGRIEKPVDFKNPEWPKVEKQAQAVRAGLRKLFGIPGNPLPFRKPRGYEAQFKIKLGKSYQH